jgi:hypothetical protein
LASHYNARSKTCQFIIEFARMRLLLLNAQGGSLTVSTGFVFLTSKISKVRTQKCPLKH